MLAKTIRTAKRKGQALVEYALLLAGIALVCVVAVAVLGEKTAEVIGVVAAVLPGAHADDNKPIKVGSIIPFDKSGSTMTLDAANLVNSAGVDRMQGLLGAGGGELLVID